MDTAASTELLTYERELARLLPDHAGEYVVIKGSTLLHFNSSLDEALRWAYAHTEDDEVFVKRVTTGAGTVHFYRDSATCRP
jgi:hypothetical protein